MALDSLRSAGGVSYAADLTVAGHAGAAPFRARPGRAKRLLQLARDMRHVGSLRGSLALLYASLGTDSRVRAMQKWSDTERGGSISQDDMRRLCDRVARGCPESAQAQVFNRITQEYCRRADTGQLAALRGTLGTAARDPDAWLARAPQGDPARKAWETLCAMLDRELARRTLITPLRQVARALPADADALDAACARLAVRLESLGDDRMARDVLSAALAQLAHAELRTLALQLAPLNTAAAAEGTGPARCPMARALAHLRSSPDLWRQRLDLIAGLQDPVAHAVSRRMDYFVHATAQLIDFQLGQGRESQAVYDLACESVVKNLEAAGYTGLLDIGNGNTLVPRLIAAALMRRPLKDVLDFVGKLHVKALSSLILAMEAGDDARLAGAARLIQGVRDEKMRPYRDRLIGCLRDLNGCLASGERGRVLAALKELAFTCVSWENDCLASGEAMPRLVDEDLRVAVQRALRLFCSGSGDSPRVFDLAALQRMCHSEVEGLRQCERGLKKYGLVMDRSALEAVARERGTPHIAIGAEHIAALAERLAERNLEPTHILHALRDGADSLATACATHASFIDMGPDETLRLCTEAAGKAWRDFVERHPDRRAAACAGMDRLGHILSNGLNDAASCVVLDHPDEQGNGASPIQPASYVAWRLRLASQLMEALIAVSAADDEVAMRDIIGTTFADRWTPALSKAVLEQFGVHYDAVLGQASLAMTPTQQRDFARELLRKDMTVNRLAYRQVASPDGPLTIDVAEQFLLDAIDRPTTRFSVMGIDRRGQYLPYTSSAPVPGEDSHVPGADRALAAVSQVAGADTVALSIYFTQAIAGDCQVALYALGPAAPIKLDDGRPVLPGGGGSVCTDVTRLADGSYVLRICVAWDHQDSVTLFTGSGVKLDAEQSYASLAFDLRMAPTPEGRWHREIISPISARYHLVEIIESDSEDSI
ncbi:hypothetical protein AKI39_23120 [Bordetella sp. H567]|nr:hypothetical protein AKI39_23120 [Bordetella sp. H567]